MTRRADHGRGAAGSTQRDAELIAELHAPGSDALAVLFRRYVRLVYRVAVGILRDEAEAEDVAQEVFLEIYRKAHQYDPSRGPFRVWLLQYAYHRSLRRKDSLRRRAAYAGEPLERVDRSAREYRGGLTREECRWIIHTGLAQLPERQRTTLELACLEELSLRDVADRLRVSLGCARHYYYRGLRRLRAWAQLAEGTRPRDQEPARHRPSPRAAAGGPDDLDARRVTREIESRGARRRARRDACRRHHDAVPLE